MAVVDFFTFFWLDGIPPPRRLEVNLHQHRPFLVIGASEHGKLSVDGGVLRDGAVDDDLNGDVLRPRCVSSSLPGGADILDHPGSGTKCQPNFYDGG
jgi:hypothetical protein